MSVSVSMPQLGESVTEGTVTRWLKKEGERVEVDEPLLEVSTDKVDTEIPSPASGILRGIAVDEDETVAVGAQLAVIEDSETSGSAPAADDASPADAAEPEPPDASQGAPAPSPPPPPPAQMARSPTMLRRPSRPRKPRRPSPRRQLRPVRPPATLRRPPTASPARPPRRLTSHSRAEAQPVF
jgi:pyruvate dehydrogenase E2 component (dihydrolipoamide acetyltransferase)